MKKTLFALMLGLSAAAAPVAALAQSPAADSRQAGYVQPLTAENSLLLLVDRSCSCCSSATPSSCSTRWCSTSAITSIALWA